MGIAYGVFVSLAGFGIPCIFYTLTGLKCPACGVTRMAVSLLRLDFVSAFRYNPFLLITSPVIAFCLIYSDVLYIRTGSGRSKWIEGVLWIETALLLLFGILRNLPIWQGAALL